MDYDTELKNPYSFCRSNTILSLYRPQEILKNQGIATHCQSPVFKNIIKSPQLLKNRLKNHEI